MLPFWLALVACDATPPESAATADGAGSVALFFSSRGEGEIEPCG